MLHPTWGPEGAETKAPLYLPPLLDQHVWPPLEIEESAEGVHKRKVLRRGIWETELYSRDGKLIPDLFWHTRPLPFADVLMDLVRVDFSGANFLAIIEQRYDSLKVIREEERQAARRAQVLLEEKERLEREAREEYSLNKAPPEEVYEKVEREEAPEVYEKVEREE